MADWWSKSVTAAVAGIAGTALYSWANSDADGILINVPALEQQSVEHPDIPACRMTRRYATYIEKPARTLYDVFKESMEKYAEKRCFGWRSSAETGFDTWLNYSEVMERVTNIGYGLRWLGQQATNDTLIGMFSKNRIEMAMTQYSCYQHSMVLVPMYDTLGEEGIQHIINQTKMQVVICDSEDKVQAIIKYGKELLPHITTIVHMNPLPGETTTAAEGQGWRVISFSDMESEGEKNPVEMKESTVEDLCVICYTSGTTGKPKGAMIKHKGLYHVMNAALEVFVQQILSGDVYTDDEAYLSYLPLAHMYEQVMIIGMLSKGARIGFYSGDVKELLNDIKYLQPTFFASVPRLLNRIHDKVVSAVSQSGIKNWLFQKALDKKEEYFRRGIITKSTVWDRLVFKKVQDLLGGRIKAIVTGAAPISPPVLRFLRLAFGAVVTEGYGQTESSAAMSASLIGEYAFGEVGAPFDCNLVKLVDVPEMDCYAKDNLGEVCCYGENVFAGYLNDEAKTKEAIDSDGWLHTGDIGRWTERGTLKIVDRKKNIFKLAQGEYVAPEKIENVYCSSPLVAQCFVHGDSLQSCVVAVVVPDADVLPTFAQSTLGIDKADMVQLCANKTVKEAVLKSMVEAAKTFKLKGFEQVKDIYLTSEPFSVENDLLTPTFKLKRIESRKKYKDVISDLYSKM